MQSLFDRIPVEMCLGLRPKVWLAVGAGFSREDFKAALLASGRGFVAEAVTSLEEIAEKIVRAAATPEAAARLRVLDPPARQEALRMLVARPEILGRLPEIRRLKRQSGFLRRLDLAIQNGRRAAAHAGEDQVMAERAEARLGPDPVRDELRFLARVYEAWLGATAESGRYEATDAPAIVARATAVLEQEGWPQGLQRPEEILVFSQQCEEGLERAFREALGRHARVERVRAEPMPDQDQVPFALGAPGGAWERWHAIDDACERLVDELLEVKRQQGHWDDVAILMGDEPAVRRSLRRALAHAGIELADARDPTRLEWEEALKWALLPLEVIAGDFERSTVIEWARVHSALKSDPLRLGHAIAEINSRGVRRGLVSYQVQEPDVPAPPIVPGAPGARSSRSARRFEQLSALRELHAELVALAARLGGRRKLGDMAEAHLQLLSESLEGARALGAEWVFQVVQGAWQRFSDDAEVLQAERRRAPPLYWLERLSQRLAQAPAPVAPLKPDHGVPVYRLQQAPFFPPGANGECAPRQVWVVGLSAGWLSGDGTGDAWWGSRDREILAPEFAIRSSHQIREERLATLRAWACASSRWVVLDSAFSPDGAERESLYPVLKEIFRSDALASEPVEHGAHPRWAPSFGVVRSEPPRVIQLGPIVESAGKTRTEISATVLDHYSRCPFQALAYDRWGLSDGREPDLELWADVRGTILHEAVKALVETRLEEGTFTLDPGQALDRAMKKVPPRGMMKSPRMLDYLRRRLVQVLESFMEKEREYFDRAKARVLALESGIYRLDFDGVSVYGEPDRVDDTSFGLFVMDYKTSSSLPSGAEMLKSGYRLQLPFYGLAVAEKHGKDLAGVQFIELTGDGNRGKGVFLAPYNGKDAGKPTKVTRANKSLVEGEPDAVWKQLKRHIEEAALGYVAGNFAAQPRYSKPDAECDGCRAADVCGYRRRVADTAEAGAEGAAEGAGA